MAKWVVFQETELAQVEAPSREAAEDLARKQYGAFSRVQSKVSAQLSGEYLSLPVETRWRRNKRRNE